MTEIFSETTKSAATTKMIKSIPVTKKNTQSLFVSTTAKIIQESLETTTTTPSKIKSPKRTKTTSLSAPKVKPTVHKSKNSLYTSLIAIGPAVVISNFDESQHINGHRTTSHLLPGFK